MSKKPLHIAYEVSLPPEADPERIRKLIEAIIPEAKVTAIRVVGSEAAATSHPQKTRQPQPLYRSEHIDRLNGALKQFGPQTTAQLQAILSDIFPDVESLKNLAEDLIRQGRLRSHNNPFTGGPTFFLPTSP